MERVGLERVLQTVGVLQAVVLRAFGPRGGQVLITRDTGELVLTRDGTRVLTALRLDHPLARMIVECASAHSARTGDGSKSFILLLASLVRTLEDAARSHQRPPHSLVRELLSFSLHQLHLLITSSVLPHAQHLTWTHLSSASSSPVKTLLCSFFHTRLSHTHRDAICDLLCNFLSHWTPEGSQSGPCLQFIVDTWPSLYTPVTGFPLSYSRLLQGQIIHRDFAVPYSQTTQRPIRAVVINTTLSPVSPTEPGLVLETGDESSLVHFNSFMESYVERVVSCLQSVGVSLLLSSVKQTDAVLGSASRSQINVVECVAQEELSLFLRLSQASTVTDVWDVQEKHVVSLESCKPLLLGAHRFVLVSFSKASLRPCSLVVCGAGEAQSEQHAASMRDAIKMLRTTWGPPTSSTTWGPPTSRTTWGPPTSSTTPSDPPRGCVLTAGGAFEVLLSLALRHSPVSKPAPVAPRILADALLCVPRHIYSNKRFLKMQNEVLQSVRQRHTSRLSGGLGLESVVCKSELLLSVLQTLSQLLTLDSVIHTRSRLKTIEHVSCQEEDEDED